MKSTNISNFFLGPKAENREYLTKGIKTILNDYIYWRKNYCPSDKLDIPKEKEWYEKLNFELQNVLSLLKANYPFYSPRYMAHMLSETLMPGILGYFAGMLYNPNNVTEEAAPVTVNLELEFGKKICQMLGFKSKDNKPTGFAHICSGGSIANLESLWLARELQFIPLIIKEFCEKNQIDDFKVKTPNMVGQNLFENIFKVSDRILLSLKPNEKIYLPTKLLQHLIENKKINKEEAIEKLNNHIKISKFSVRWAGFINVMNNVKLKPIIFVPESAHYSWDKTISILGYGNASIKRIPITSKFRIDVKKLKEMLYNLKNDEFVIAVITVAGTTEEGAVDPIHKVQLLREQFEKDKNMSFWLHIDSAWGGFIRSLFNVDEYRDLLYEKFQDESIEKEFLDNKKQMEEKYKSKNKPFTTLDENSLKIKFLMNLEEIYYDKESFFTKGNQNKEIKLVWDDLNVIKAFLTFKEADSITIDPHKLGYIQYPAGVIAFKNANIVQFIAQKASYISKVKNGVEKIFMDEVNSIGPYIIEGSKPGASAVACWLSEKTIPFNINNHGQILKVTLLNSKRFLYFINKLNKENIGISFRKENRVIKKPYKIIPAYENIDTNLVCFFILPMLWSDESKTNILMIKDVNLNLKNMNDLNENIYKKFTIINEGNDYIFPHSIKFFLSRTKFTSEQYSYESIKKLMEENFIKKDEYEKEGLFIIRATLMNPWHYNQKSEEIDYYLEFFKEFNKVIVDVINEFNSS